MSQKTKDNCDVCHEIICDSYDRSCLNCKKRMCFDCSYGTHAINKNYCGGLDVCRNLECIYYHMLTNCQITNNTMIARILQHTKDKITELEDENKQLKNEILILRLTSGDTSKETKKDIKYCVKN